MRGPRRLLHALALAASIAVAPRAAAVEFDVDTAGLTADERAASDAVLAEAARRLPPAWNASLGRLRVEWRDDLPARVEGRYRGGTLRLQRRLLHGPHGAPPTHGAVATVLHELAHAWDRGPHGGLSRDARLLDLAGWSASPVPGVRLRASDFRDRTPDAYELRSPAEFVAVNLEHALLDDGYACRRPALHRYFEARAGAGWTQPACAPPVFVVPASEGAADPSPLLELDPARVYAVDYLLAESDAQPMSRWGHSMLRLVVCAPGRTPGPDCRLDLAWHVVLSFRAFVDDVQISSWRGLAGGYPSRLFVLPLPQVVEEYTKVELRGLRAVPLRLSRDEIAALLDRAAQVHWSYDGRYRFVTRNCAVETWRLLHDGVPRIAAADIGSLTPTGLLRRLERAGIADPAPLMDADEARRLGYRFDALAAHFDALLASALGPQARTTAKQWLAMAPESRRRRFADADLRASAALLVLENAALRRAELRAADALKHRLARVGALHAQVRDTLATAALLARPASLAPAGYGVPDGDERIALRARVAAATTDARTRAADLRTAAEAALPPRDRQMLAGIRDNVDAIGAQVRRLAAQADETTPH